MKKTKFLFFCVIILSYTLSSGLMFFIHRTGDAQLDQNIENFFSERGAIDRNLRNQIVTIQKKIVNLPKIFTNNKRSLILNKLSSLYQVDKKEDITNREIFAKIFSRSERKEIFSGKIIVQLLENKLYYAYAIIDENGDFLDSINRIQVKSENTSSDFNKITNIINADFTEENKTDYERQIAILKKICIDSALEAERTRLEFVSRENDISTVNNKFLESNKENNKQLFFWALLVFAGDTLFILLFSFMTVLRRR